ncbi:MAG: CHAD domain-containing protein, partial [Acidobacteriota bacterium]
MIRTTLARVWRDQTRRLAMHLQGAIDGHVGAVHRSRVASRRLREVLAVMLAIAPGKPADRARREMRRVTRALGPVREIDVALEALDELGAHHAWTRDRRAA